MLAFLKYSYMKKLLNAKKKIQSKMAGNYLDFVIYSVKLSQSSHDEEQNRFYIIAHV